MLQDERLGDGLGVEDQRAEELFTAAVFERGEVDDLVPAFNGV